jgi:TolA-binding protein
MKMYSRTTSRCRLLAVLVLGGLSWAACAGAQEAAVDPKDALLRQEMEYVRRLQRDLRMPDFADQVIQQLKRKFPDAGARLKVLEVEGLLAQGSFDKVKAQIAALPDPNGAEAWAMKLAMADSLYAFSKQSEAFALYDAFFKQFATPPPALESFYAEAAYKYPQMLLLIRQDEKALEAYRRLLKLALPPQTVRQVQAEAAELIIRIGDDSKKKESLAPLLVEANKYVDGLLWDSTDIWFGKAIVLKAHIKLLQGNVGDAQKMVEDYMPQLRAIHDSLVEQDKAEGSSGYTRISPMAECRYLLAVMLQNEAVKLGEQPGFDEEKVKSLLLGERGTDGKRKGNGAYNHFLNVFVRYPESQWAADAGEHVEQLRVFIQTKFGAELKVEVTDEQMARVRQMQFADARAMFNENRFADAVGRYLTTLNRFPEVPESVPALGELAHCYVETRQTDINELLADMVMAHLAERFARHPKLANAAGDELRRLADYCGAQGLEDKRRRGYDLFFRNFPNNPNAALLVMDFAGKAYKDKDYPAALRYYQQVTTTYANSPWCGDAFSRIASIYADTQDYTNEIQALSTYVSYLERAGKPGIGLMSARFRYAQASRNYGAAQLKGATNDVVQMAGVRTLVAAVAAFDKAATELAEAKALGAAEQDQAKQLLEQAVFQKALALTQISYPADKVPALRQKAITSYDEFVTRFPESKLAPRALLQIGTLYTVLKQAEKAQEALARLRKAYPDSDEARSSVPMLAASLMDLDLRAEGVAMYKQMFADAATKYTDAQILAAGKALVESKPPESELALQAFDRVAASAKDVALLAQARLGRAQALAALKRLPDANRELTAFIKDYPNLQLVVDANFQLAQVASSQGEIERDDAKRKQLFNAAADALRMVKRYRTTPAELAELDIAAGRVLLRKQAAEKTLGLSDQMAKTRGEAIVAFKLIIMNTDPGNALLAPYLEQAYALCIPLMIEHGKPQAAAEDCAAYLQAFPNGKFATDVRTWQNQAQIELSTGTSRPAAPVTK